MEKYSRLYHHTYLHNLLDKHEKGEPLYFEDLQNSWTRVSTLDQNERKKLQMADGGSDDKGGENRQSALDEVLVRYIFL